MKVKPILKAGLASLCFFITSCGAKMNNATEFEWHATEAAPEHYPMEIIVLEGAVEESFRPR
ncbi:MAG: hypothetical protein EOP48_16030 [Sphingobacteriales bacterium]|nr:MAG: hypothetical protein EOP48_16030 [Sphingobacteriales bacterium]